MIVDCLAHVHSSFSYDSPTDLGEIAATARRHRIQCVLMSEHNNTLDPVQVGRLVERCGEVSTADCLVVPGLELSLDDNRVHLLAYGVREFIPSLHERSLGGLIRQVHHAGGVAVLAHPAHKAALTRLDPDDLRGLDGMEIWNIRNGSRFCPHADELAGLTALRRRGISMAAFAGLDWHYLRQFERLALRVQVDALRAADVLTELKAGRFSIHGRFVSFRQDRNTGVLLRAASSVSTRTLLPLRRAAYRWQARLEQRGWRAPDALTSVARRIF